MSRSVRKHGFKTFKPGTWKKCKNRSNRAIRAKKSSDFNNASYKRVASDIRKFNCFCKSLPYKAYVKYYRERIKEIFYNPTAKETFDFLKRYLIK
jgi:hypothetical protein